MYFCENSKVEKNVATWDPAWQVLSPGEEIGGGVNPPFKDEKKSKPLIPRRAGGIQI